MPDIVGQRADAPTRLAGHLNDLMFGQPAVKSAIDMAAWDLAARLAGRPLSDLLGGADGDAVPLYRSVSQAEPAAMADQANAFVEQGYRRLQVKVGGQPTEDIERLRAVRDAVPDDVVLTLTPTARGGLMTPCGSATVSIRSTLFSSNRACGWPTTLRSPQMFKTACVG